MPRKPRQASESGVYHFISRGVIKRKLFHGPEDYKKYLSLAEEHALENGIKIYHYCLMNNHTHILLRSPDIKSLSCFGHYLQRRYAYYYSRTHHWFEQVFRKRFAGIPIDKDAYLLECGRYIERNPVRAKLVEDPRNFDHSSYVYYAHGFKNRLLTQNPLYEDMGATPKARMAAYKSYVGQSRPYEEILDKSIARF